MKLSTTTAIYRDRPEGMCKIPILDCIKRLHQVGYRDVDINFNQMSKRPLELSREHWQDWAKEVRELLDQLGMTASQCHVPFYNVLDSTCIPNREHTEEMIRRALIAAGEMGVKTAVIHAGTYVGENDFSKNLRGNMEYLKPHIELAAKYDICIAVENMFDRKDLRTPYFRKYTSHPDELVELCDALRQQYDNVGICWDFGHGNIMGWNQVQALEQIGSRLKALHVDDNYGAMDNHLLPFTGTIDWLPIMKTLKKIDYQGVFAYETHTVTMNMPEAMLDHLLAYSVELGNYLISVYEEA